MKIKIKCFATLSGSNPPDGALELPDGATVRSALDRLGLTEADIKLVFVNSKNSSLETPLHSDDQVGLFPAVGGG